jgi:lysine-N-methylase
MAGFSVRAPRYLGRFQCVGAACEDHCCAGWGGIDVDPPTAEAYRTLAGRGDRRAVALNLLDNLAPNPDAWPDQGGEAALIPLEPGGSCPFLTDERLCGIQGDLGEKLLSSTCDTFPRQATQIDNTIDLAGRLSCPEIVRLALLTEDALVMESVEPDRRLRQRGTYWIDRPWEDAPDLDDPRRHFHLVRARAVALLQHRDSSLTARMLALGLAMGGLTGGDGFRAPDVDGTFDLAEGQLPDLKRWLAETGLEDSPSPSGRGLGEGSPTPRGPHRLLPRRLRTWIAMPDLPARFRKSLDRVKQGLGLPDDATAPLEGALGERVARAYANARRDHLEPYLAQRPWVFENLLVNQIWLTTFPYHPERTFAEEHALLAFRVGLVRFQIVGAAAHGGALTDDLLVETVQAFDKYVDGHDFWDRTYRLMKREKALDPASLAALLLA